jgi:phage-related protein
LGTALIKSRLSLTKPSDLQVTSWAWFKSGRTPDQDWKPMETVGAGVKEIRIRFENSYRVFYVAKFNEAVYVLHAFVKKTPRTSERDIDLGTDRYKALIKSRNTK